MAVKLRGSVLLAALASAAVVLASCSAGSAAPGGPAGPADSGGHSRTSPGTSTHPANPGHLPNWPMYHLDQARSGTEFGLPQAGPLSIAWSTRLDGAVYGQPLVVRGQVIAATEGGSVYGIGRSTGKINWRTHIASPLPLRSQPCGDIDPIGITSTPVYYRGLVYALAQDGKTGHLLVGIDPANGAVRYRRMVPSPDGHPFYDQQRSSLAAEDGRIYVTFGGHAGDCGPYVGSVVGMPASRDGSGKIVSYLVPSHNHAGIWAPGGPAIGQDGTLYVGVGNGDTKGPFDDSDSVTALSPALHRIGIFAPLTWVADNRGDLDLGSMTPALIPGGQIVMGGKRGLIYLLNAAHLGGIGGEVAKLAVCATFGGAAVAGSTVIVPCASGGPAALKVGAQSLTLSWRGPDGADGSPVIGGGAVWVTANSAGVLYELSEAAGQVLSQIKLGALLPHFTSPSLSGNLVLAGTLHGVVAVKGA